MSDTEEQTDHHLLQLAIGDKNTSYYMDFLQRAEDWPASWNWPAFFTTTGWMLYRKLWAEWLIYAFAVPIVALIVGTIIGAVSGNPMVGIGLYYVVMAVVALALAPIYANAMYARKIKRLVVASQRIEGRTERAAWLAARGGTSWAWVIVLVLIIPVTGILAAIAFPAYQSYIQTANTASVYAHYNEAVLYVTDEMANAKHQVEVGEVPLVRISGRDWVGELNGLDPMANNPEGGAPFGAAADDASGTIGVTVSGSISDIPITYAVTITRPAYGDFEENGQRSETVHW